MRDKIHSGWGVDLRGEVKMCKNVGVINNAVGKNKHIPRGRTLGVSKKIPAPHGPQAFGRKQCFIHGNGRSRGPMWDLLGSFARSPYGKRYLKIFAKKEDNVTQTEKEMKTLKKSSE